jgi:hypothetical protein
MTKIAKVLKLDSKKRICLGSLVNESVAGYKPYLDIKTGRIILEPYIEMPMNESWLHNNKDAFESVKQGIAESATGDTASLGNFQKFLDNNV